MIIGIDLGTTNSLAACFQDGRACIIPNRLRKNLTPSVVAVDEKAQILVGETAREYGRLHPERMAEVFKRFMGSERQYDPVSYTHLDYNVSQEAMLRQVDEAGFAVVDANLYLDTHPCDAAAIDYYNQMLAAYKSAAAAYEAQFGPLTAGANKDTDYWSWVNDPWPWEGVCS